MTCAKLPAPPASYVAPAELVLVAIWFGLLTGLVEVAMRAVQKFLLHQRIFVSYYTVWMAPVADVVCLAIPGCVLALLAWRWPRLVSLRSGIFMCVLLGCLGPLLTFQRLHPYAAWALAAGMAVQAARLIATHAQGFSILVRRTLGWMIALVVGLAVSVHGWEILAERQAIARLPVASPNAPNVLLIVLDTVRAASLSLYGYGRPTTPQLERLATRSVVFERAWATSPWTLPSHATMFTGRYPHEVLANWLTPLDARDPTLADVLSAHGYLTSGFVANFFYGTYESGLNRGFIHYEDFVISPEVIAHSSWLARMSAVWLRRSLGNYRPLVRKTAVDINDDFLSWLSSQDQRPFFAFLNYMDAHGPYLPPPPFDTQFGAKKSRPGLPVLKKWSAQELQDEIVSYDGAIAYLDHQLGFLFEELHKRGVLDNTLLIVTSDHGEQLGEHGLLEHGNSLYRPLLHVPLLFSFPARLPSARRIPEPVSLRDLPATILDILGLGDSSALPGTSLASHWYGGGPPGSSKSALLAAVSKCIKMGEAWGPGCKGDMQSLLADGLHYIKHSDDVEELYDFESDPAEGHDLAGTEGSRQVLEHFRHMLTTVLSAKR